MNQEEEHKTSLTIQAERAKAHMIQVGYAKKTINDYVSTWDKLIINAHNSPLDEDLLIRYAK